MAVMSAHCVTAYITHGIHFSAASHFPVWKCESNDQHRHYILYIFKMKTMSHDYEQELENGLCSTCNISIF